MTMIFVTFTHCLWAWYILVCNNSSFFLLSTSLPLFPPALRFYLSSRPMLSLIEYIFHHISIIQDIPAVPYSSSPILLHFSLSPLPSIRIFELSSFKPKSACFDHIILNLVTKIMVFTKIGILLIEGNTTLP